MQINAEKCDFKWFFVKPNRAIPSDESKVKFLSLFCMFSHFDKRKFMEIWKLWSTIMRSTTLDNELETSTFKLFQASSLRRSCRGCWKRVSNDKNWLLQMTCFNFPHKKAWMKRACGCKLWSEMYHIHVRSYSCTISSDLIAKCICPT